MFAWLVLALVWWASGVVSFIFWWTMEWDFVRSFEVFVAIFAGMAGPFAFPLGAFIHRDAPNGQKWTNPCNNKILIPYRWGRKKVYNN